ncbi:very short patch repair endonuclease [Pseudooceanicola atlanticus]|uniref:very short patch repair endonuclease n=1 Tax=Pseudooceanicola atlanticus TaxID=1461694 RepID=UPI00235366A7|nr:very short patch repair endonuclease [Pseudooceanicola atlanticus]
MTARFEHVDPIRRRIMSAVRGRDTKPEMLVRRLLHSMNYRYRLHRKDLPGHPDVVFGKRKKAIFVHGCFWHRHEGCKKATVPKTRADFWAEKFSRNVERDHEVESKLAEMGWQTLTVWECETKEVGVLQGKLRDFLEAEKLPAAERERLQA